MATQKQIAEHLDLSPKRVSELYRDSILTSNSIDATRVQYICYLRKLSGYNKKTGTGDMQEEKTRLTKAQDSFVLFLRESDKISERLNSRVKPSSRAATFTALPKIVKSVFKWDPIFPSITEP